MELSEIIKIENEKSEFLLNLIKHMNGLLGTRYWTYLIPFGKEGFIELIFRDCGTELNSKCIEKRYKITNNHELTYILNARSRKYLKSVIKQIGNGKFLSESTESEDKFKELVDADKLVDETVSKFESHIQDVIDYTEELYHVQATLEPQNNRLELIFSNGDSFEDIVTHIENNLDFKNILEIKDKDEMLEYLQMG